MQCLEQDALVIGSEFHGQKEGCGGLGRSGFPALIRVGAAGADPGADADVVKDLEEPLDVVAIEGQLGAGASGCEPLAVLEQGVEPAASFGFSGGEGFIEEGLARSVFCGWCPAGSRIGLMGCHGVMAEHFAEQDAVTRGEAEDEVPALDMEQPHSRSRSRVAWRPYCWS